MSDNFTLLQEVAQKKSAIKWFSGLFNQIHMHITDTDEKFTILHKGDSFEVITGYHADNPNFVIPLQSENISNLKLAFSDDLIDAQEEYRIVKFMFKPCLRAVMDMPVLRNKKLSKILKVETHWQEAIVDPQGNEDEQLTIVFVNNQWLIFPGYNGVPERRMLFQPNQLLEFQRRILEADEKNNISSWIEVANWYIKFREEATVPV